MPSKKIADFARGAHSALLAKYVSRSFYPFFSFAARLITVFFCRSAFDEYYIKGNLAPMKKLIAGHVNTRQDQYLSMLKEN